MLRRATLSSPKMLQLPIDPLIPEILDKIRKYDRVILTATPGAGKTTRLPAHLLEAINGKIAVLEPRRIAAIGAAAHIAEEQKWQLGGKVGYQVRFDSKITEQTRLIFMTDALLLRQLGSDPELKQYDLVVIDEFHERNLNQDVAIGIIKELQDLGRNIKLLVMSATLDVVKIRQFLPDSVHIEVPGQVFPLDVRFLQKPLRPVTDFDFIKRVADTTISVAAENRGDILVFLPGVSEISRLQEQLDNANLGRDVLPLHGSLPLAEQKKALAPSTRRRIILSTNIAEASVTVPGTDTVIDTGLARIVTMNLKSGFERIELTRIAQFNARQRAGRAARQKAGLCVRMWTSFEDASLDEQMTPEIQRADLADTLLLLAHFGVSDFTTFSWLDRPPKPLVDFAFQFLLNVGAMDSSKKMTDIGKKLLNLPLPIRWGALLVLAEKEDLGNLGVKAAALLGDRDIMLKKADIHSHTECDVTFRLRLLEEVEGGGRPSGINIRQADSILASQKQLFQYVKTGKGQWSENDLRRILLLSQTDRLCRRRNNDARAVMVGGRGIRLAPESQVKTSEFFVSLQAIELPGQPDTTVTIASGFDKAFVLEHLKDKIEIVEDAYFDEVKGQFFARRIRRYKDLDLDEPSLSPLKPDEIGSRFAEALANRWEWLITQNENLESWLARWKFFCSLDAKYEDAFGKTEISEALSQACYGKTKVSEVVNENLAGWLESVMDKATVTEFHRQAPSYFTAATGNRYPIHYGDTEPPFVEVRLQEMFGVRVNPRLGFEKVALTFKLLAPNYRPTQVTSDIASFWQNTYFEVRKELRSRYPKHSWPDDPLTAPPVAKGRKRT